MAEYKVIPAGEYSEEGKPTGFVVAIMGKRGSCTPVSQVFDSEFKANVEMERMIDDKPGFNIGATIFSGSAVIITIVLWYLMLN